MEDVRQKFEPPAIDKVSFNCPRCGALAQQHWYSTHANRLGNGKTPMVKPADDFRERLKENIPDPDDREPMLKLLEGLAAGEPFFSGKGATYTSAGLGNVSVSSCYACESIAIWIHDRLAWPPQGTAPPPNADLPDDIRRDYLEADSILDLSPRGATALLRLCVQKLCQHLEAPGKTIDEQIGSLVKQGLDIKIQRALDIVRVSGNNAVHPGQIDMDDCATAEELFRYVNLIASQLISLPKEIDESYEMLPEGARKGIERRDGAKPK